MALYKTPSGFAGMESDKAALSKQVAAVKVEIARASALKYAKPSFLELETLLGHDTVKWLAGWERAEVYLNWAERKFTEQLRNYFWLRAAIVLEANRISQIAGALWPNPTAMPPPDARIYLDWDTYLSDERAFSFLRLVEQGPLQSAGDLDLLGFSKRVAIMQHQI